MAHVAEPSPAVDLASLPPEGPPTAAQATAPVLDLEPGASALHFPPTEVQYDGRTTEEKALGPPPMTIYQVDIESLPETPWRRPGANLSDWFNYGFDEQTWAKWCAKKLSMDQTRQDLQADSGEVPFAPDTGVSGGAHGAQDDAMAQFSAMFGPGAMMGMPQWPMMPEGMPPMMPPMPGMPEGPDALPSAPPSVASALDSGDAPYEPRSPPPHGGGGMPPFAVPPDGEGRSESGSGSSSRRSRRSRHESRGVARGANAYGSSAPGWGRRGGPRADDSTGDDDYTRNPRYTDRDTAHGAGDALDYGDEPRRHRRVTPPAHDDDRHTHSHHDDGHHGRHRSGRRDRERRSDRRSGRGGQKRGAPDHDDADHTSKRSRD